MIEQEYSILVGFEVTKADIINEDEFLSDAADACFDVCTDSNLLGQECYIVSTSETHGSSAKYFLEKYASAMPDQEILMWATWQNELEGYIVQKGKLYPAKVTINLEIDTEAEL